jgi:MFS family permease
MVYAINWLNVGAIFVLMETDLGAGVGGLGTLTSAFYLGIGLMQLPGGLMAARWGPKNAVVPGIFLDVEASHPPKDGLPDPVGVIRFRALARGNHAALAAVEERIPSGFSPSLP